MKKEHKDTGAPDEEFRDIDIEADTELGDLGAARAKLTRLKDALDAIKKEKQEYLEGWQRCKADSINARREAEARAARSGELMREALIRDIIPALDSFDMAALSEAWAEVSDGWKSGMELVRDQLVDALRRHGVERFGKVGEKFDHALHEATEERDDVPGEPGTVARIMRYGYRSKDRILRPAQVILKS